MSRQEANKQILDILLGFVNDFPDMRFHQILQNVGLEIPGGEDQFYEESDWTLQCLKTRVSKSD